MTDGRPGQAAPELRPGSAEEALAYVAQWAAALDGHETAASTARAARDGWMLVADERGATLNDVYRAARMSRGQGYRVIHQGREGAA